MRRMMTAALLMVLCSVSGTAGANVGKDVDADVAGAAHTAGDRSEADYFRCSDMPRRIWTAPELWANNQWGLQRGAFSYLGAVARPFVEMLNTSNQTAVYAVGDMVLTTPWPLTPGHACIPGVRLHAGCPR